MPLQFEPIQLEKQRDYATLLSRCPVVASDYSFLNLWAWAEDYGLHWAWEDAVVWIQQTRPEKAFWAPVGAWEKIDWSNRFAGDKSTQTSFVRIPQQLAENWQSRLGDLATITEDRGHWDYIYSSNDLIELKGNRYHKKKNLLAQFKKNYVYTYLPFGPELIERALGMQTDWCTWRDCESSDILSAENRAIFKILQQWNQLSGAMGGAIIVDQAMVAYTIAEEISASTVLIHFEKGDTNYKGVYQAINQMFLANSVGDHKLVNREQDLNDAGLRKAKMSYFPVDFVRKYRAMLKGVFIA